MRTFRLAACAALFVLAPIALAACGGSDSSSQDEDDITAAITTAATSDDPSICTTVQTENFVKQTSGSLEDCKKDPSADAGSVDVSNIDVSGDSATADAKFAGGFVAGQTLTLALVKEGDQWKLDQLKGFAEFDRDAYTAGALNELSKQGDVPPQALACLKQQFEKATDQQLQDLVLKPMGGGDAIFEPCFKG